MKIDLYVLHVLGGKVTTEIVILQMQLEFLKITSIPVYKAATDYCNHGDLQQGQELILSLMFQTRKC